MKNIIDIYGSLVDHCGEEKKGLQYYGHAFINKDGYFIGTADDVNSDGYYFIYGKQSGNELFLTRCIIGGNPNVIVENTAERVDKTNGFVGQTILKFNGNNYDLGKCKFVAMPADKTRELRTEEIYTLWDEIHKRSTLLSSFQREAYKHMKILYKLKRKKLQKGLYKKYIVINKK